MRCFSTKDDNEAYRTRRRAAIICAGILTLIFVQPLCELVRYAAGNDLHSHILLIPFVSVYLLHIRRKALALPYVKAYGLTALVLLVGIAAVAIDRVHTQSLNSHLALAMFAYVSCGIAVALFCLGVRWVMSAAFPLGFLFFMVPLPDVVVHALETASQIASTEVADVFFRSTGMPFIRDGMVFQLPGIAIEVAQECSGIRSSWVLFMTGLVVSNLFLNSPWRRVVLALVVIPLGVLRNGFRIFVIGILCAEIGPHMIHSVIHRHGGPLFFVLSLVPLAAFAVWLRRNERSPQVEQWAPRNQETKAALITKQ